MTWKTSGINEKLIKRLEDTIKNGNISHAYIFEGDSNADKLTFANDFTKAILCKELPGIGCDHCVLCSKVNHGNHEDIFYVAGHGKTMRVKDEDIEQVQERLRNKPNGERNIAVISNADTMTSRAQNRFLKTLEEPPQGAVILLLSENIENLAQTILSRCVKYRLESPTKTQASGEDTEAMEIQNVIQMLLDREPFYKIKPKIEEISSEIETTHKFLDMLENQYRDFFFDRKRADSYTKDEIYNAVIAVEAARREIHRGVAKSYALKKLVMKTGG